jgi:hypothetical protein
MAGTPMTTLWQIPAIAVYVWLTTPPGSLAAAALQEAIRRGLTPKSVLSFSIYDWPSDASVPSTRPPPQDARETAAPPAGTTPAAAGSGRGTAEEPQRDEAWWRSRMEIARAALSRDLTLADAMQSHVSALRVDADNRDDPAQQAQLRQRLKTALAELDRLHKQIAADRQAIADIEDEARRLGIPPGWIRGDAISSGRSP